MDAAPKNKIHHSCWKDTTTGKHEVVRWINGKPEIIEKGLRERDARDRAAELNRGGAPKAARKGRGK